MTVILDGKKLRDKILDNIKSELEGLGTRPTLAVILVGENPASQTYVKNKHKIAQKIGINSQIINYPADTNEEVILNKLKELNKDDKITAILVQLPLPEHISKEKIINAIDPKKDVDGFTPYNFGRLFSGEFPIVYPCTPKGVMLLLDEYNIELEGRHAVVIGRSNIVGRPMAQMLLNRNATVTVCHSHTKNLSQITKTADIIVCAVGQEVLNSDMVKKDAVVIDVGISKDINGKLHGDVDFDSVSKVASYITPVPGGVGPMTIASLMLNTLELFKQKNRSL